MAHAAALAVSVVMQNVLATKTVVAKGMWDETSCMPHGSSMLCCSVFSEEVSMKKPYSCLVSLYVSNFSSLSNQDSWWALMGQNLMETSLEENIKHRLPAVFYKCIPEVSLATVCMWRDYFGSICMNLNLVTFLKVVSIVGIGVLL